VFGRALVTGENVSSIGKEFADVINNRQPYEGFFSLEPKAAPTNTTSNTSEIDEALAIMKRDDPDLNVDYVRNAFNNAPPEKQQELLAKVRERRLALSDVTAVDK
jgi:hypothetical protein